MTAWYEKARAIMRDKGMSIRELSDKLGLTPGGAGHYLSGRRHPRPGMLRQIARELNVSIAELVEDDPSFARDKNESDLLDLFRAIDEADKAAALAMLNGLAKPRDAQDT